MKEGRIRRNTIALLAILSLFGGCAGRNFTRADPNSLTVGTTTEAEVRQRFGTPYREGTVLKNSETMKSLAYAYATTATSVPDGIIPARNQAFYFWRDILVGHEFTSSFTADRTDFDGAKVRQITKGETTESAVLGLLGPPHGVYTFPLIAGKDVRASVYLYSQTRGNAFNLKTYTQLLIVQFDGSGIVRGLEFTSSGER